MRKKITTLFILTILPTFLQAQELISCTSIANIKTRCTVDQSAELGYEIQSTIDGNPVSEQTEFSVEYILDCRKSPIYLSISSGAGQSSLINDGQSHTSVVLGASALKVIDANPSDTYRRYYQNTCSLNISNVNTLPSQTTINRWTADALDQADDIAKSLSLYELAKEYVQYRDWSKSKTEVLLTAVKRKVTYFTNRCNGGEAAACSAKVHFQVVANSLQAKLDNDDSTLPPSGDESDVLIAYYREQLTSEVAIGKEMIQRFEYWDLAINEALDDILLQLPSEIGSNS